MSPKRRRRFLRYSLRTMLVVVLVLSVWLGWMANLARRQRNAVKRATELGASMAFAFQLDERDRWIRDPQPWAPDWLRSAVGEDYFRRIAIVNFDEGSDPTDGDLALLENFPDLRQLTLTDRRKITDEGLRYIAPLKQLTVLTLRGTQVRGPGLHHISDLENLELLTFDHTPLTDEGLRHLKNLTNLYLLHLSDTKITDEGLPYLAHLTSLESLDLSNTDVSDAGLKHLVGLKRLKRISLSGTNVTKNGVAELQAALPNCQIDH